MIKLKPLFKKKAKKGIPPTIPQLQAEIELNRITIAGLHQAVEENVQQVHDLACIIERLIPFVKKEVQVL